MNKKVVVSIVIFILLSSIAYAFFDTIQQAMIFLQAGSNIKLTPNPIVTTGKIDLVDYPAVLGIITNNVTSRGGSSINFNESGDILVWI